LNTGQLIGTVKAFKYLNERQRLHLAKVQELGIHADDQAITSVEFTENKAAYDAVGGMAIEYNSDLFFSAYDSYNSVKFDEKDKKFRYIYSNRIPAVMHFNGLAKAFMPELARKLLGTERVWTKDMKNLPIMFNGEKKTFGDVCP
jgi:hypothetical protein